MIHRHPDVHRVGRQPKELHFFDRSWEQPFGEADIQRYWRYFPRPESGVAGEWTPGYLIDFWTPELIARAAPEARVLVLLRDPIERLRSGLTHQQATSREALTGRDIQGAFQRGLYAPQMRRVFAAFAAERVFVGQYEACRADPRTELARTFDFIGLSPFELDDGAFRSEVNPTTGQKLTVAAPLRRASSAGAPSRSPWSAGRASTSGSGRRARISCAARGESPGTRASASRSRLVSMDAPLRFRERLDSGRCSGQPGSAWAQRLVKRRA